MFVSWAATPKSAIFTFPVLDNNTFAALMSRWIFPDWWR